MTRSALHDWHGEPIPGSRAVVVGVTPGQDGSVVRVAARLALGLRAPLVCVWVDGARAATGTAPEGGAPAVLPDPDQVDDRDVVAGQVELAETLDVQLAAHPGPWRVEYVAGDIAGGLARAAAEHDAWLIVVGTRGRGRAGWADQLVGRSLAGYLAHTQSVPVTVVPTTNG